jgi:hypothetical protein
MHSKARIRLRDAQQLNSFGLIACVIGSRPAVGRLLSIVFRGVGAHTNPYASGHKCRAPQTVPFETLPWLEKSKRSHAWGVAVTVHSFTIAVAENARAIVAALGHMVSKAADNDARRYPPYHVMAENDRDAR